MRPTNFTSLSSRLSNTGASRHKQLLRFAGIIFGACVIGFATQAIILPQIDSLFAFMILFASVIAVGAWVGTSGPRIAYAGAQIVLAYDLVNLNRFTITTSLVPARDTVLGIMLGIFAMWLIFDHLWAKNATDSMRKLFLSALREVGRLDLSAESISPAVQSRRLLAESARINARLDNTRSLADFSVFEPHSKGADGAYLGELIKMLLPQLRCFLLLKTGLLQHRLISEPSEDDALALAEQQRASSILLAIEQILESGRGANALEPAGTAYPTSRIAPSVARSAHEYSVFTVQGLLSSSLLNVAEHLQADSLLLVGSRNEQPDGANLLLNSRTYRSLDSQ